MRNQVGFSFTYRHSSCKSFPENWCVSLAKALKSKSIGIFSFLKIVWRMLLRCSSDGSPTSHLTVSRLNMAWSIAFRRLVAPTFKSKVRTSMPLLTSRQQEYICTFWTRCRGLLSVKETTFSFIHCTGTYNHHGPFFGRRESIPHEHELCLGLRVGFVIRLASLAKECINFVNENNYRGNLFRQWEDGIDSFLSFAVPNRMSVSM